MDLSKGGVLLKGQSPVESSQPAGLGTPGAADKLKLFEALGTSDGVLNFGNVVLNDLHVLRAITLRNLTAERLCINIRCKSAQLQDQVFFQLENQNLGVQDDQAIQAVFNEINHLDKFFLEPRAEQQLVVSVRPRDQNDPNVKKVQKDEQMASRQALDDQGAMSHMVSRHPLIHPDASLIHPYFTRVDPKFTSNLLVIHRPILTDSCL